jgi:hypothetical protein
MADLKLSKLPERTPVRVAITVTPDLAADLALYAELYRDHYGRDEPIAELIPAMLSQFLGSDRTFVKARRDAASRSPP